MEKWQLADCSIGLFVSIETLEVETQRVASGQTTFAFIDARALLLLELIRKCFKCPLDYPLSGEPPVVF